MSKPKPKHRSPSYAKLRRAARRPLESGYYDPETEASVYLSAYELQGIEALARRHRTTWDRELHRAIDAHIQSDGQSPVRRVNELIVRFHASLERNSRLLKEELRKIRKMRVHLAHQQSRSPRSRR